MFAFHRRRFAGLRRRLFAFGRRLFAFRRRLLAFGRGGFGLRHLPLRFGRLLRRDCLFLGSGLGLRRTLGDLGSGCLGCGLSRCNVGSRRPERLIEMLAQGPAKDIDDCIQDIKEYFGDYLRETRIQEIPPDPKYKDFRITF